MIFNYFLFLFIILFVVFFGVALRKKYLRYMVKSGKGDDCNRRYWERSLVWWNENSKQHNKSTFKTILIFYTLVYWVITLGYYLSLNCTTCGVDLSGREDLILKILQYSIGGVTIIFILTFIMCLSGGANKLGKSIRLAQ